MASEGGMGANRADQPSRSQPSARLHPESPSPSDPCTVREAADLIGVRVSQVHRWIKAGVLKVDGTEEYEIGRGAMGRRYLLNPDTVEHQAEAMAALRRRRPLYAALATSPRRPYLSKKEPAR